MKTSLKKLTAVFLAVLLAVSVFSVVGVAAADTNKAATGGGGTTGSYYLIGYIDGADYGDGEDYANMGDYHFVNGQVTATFTQDSYVCVKDTNMVWYMTQGFLGTDVTSATLYNSSITGTQSDKLYVPAGTHTFTLSENGDGSLTLSYDGGSQGGGGGGSQGGGEGGGQGGGGGTTGSYYLIGYIDGADYGDGEDYANMGDYHFVNGQVTATFTQDSYVCVKDTNMVWYMTQGFPRHRRNFRNAV